MAEREATIVIKWVSDPAEGKAAYDEIRKYAEANPIGLKFATAGGRAGETATFAGGGPNPISSGMPGVAARNAPAYNPGEAGIQQAVSIRHANVGGTNFSPATMPVGTAYVNGVYGDATRATMNAAVIGAASNATATRAGLPTRMGGAATYAGNGGGTGLAVYGGIGGLPRPQGMPAPGEYPFEGEVIGRSLPRTRFVESRVVSPRLLGDGRAVYGPEAGPKEADHPDWRPKYGPWDVPGGRVRVTSEPPYKKPRAYDWEQEGGGPGRARDGRDVDGIAGARRGSTGIEKFAAVAGGATAIAAYADQQVAAYQRQRDVNRYDSTLDAAEQSYQDQRGVTGFSRSVGGFLNSTAGKFLSPLFGAGALSGFGQLSGGFVDQNSIDDARDTAMTARGQARGNELIMQSRATNAAANIIGSEGFGAAALSAREANRATTEGLRAEKRGFNGRLDISAGVNAADRLQSAQLSDIGAQVGQAVRSSLAGVNVNNLSGSNNPFAAGLAGIDASAQARRFSLERNVRGLSADQSDAIRQADDATYASERGAFTSSYNRSTNIGTFGIRSSTAASQLARRGDSYGAEVLGIRADTAGTLAGLAGYEQYQSDPTRVGDADRARINATIGQGRERLAGAAQNRLGSLLGSRLDLQAGAQALNFDPFGAQRSRIEADVTRRTAGQDPRNVDVRIANAQADQAIAGVNQAQALQRIDTSRSLATESRSLDFRFARNTIGADASDMAGGAIDRLQQLARSGQGDLVEKARTNSLRSLDLQGQSYGLSFRGREIDLQHIIPDSQRDGQDPATVFASINEARGLVKNANANEGRVIETKISSDDQRSLAKEIATQIVALIR